MHIAIIGAGISGLMTALELAEQGCSVDIFDQHQAGQAASWAGGGILSPMYPWRYAPEVNQLAQYGKSLRAKCAEFDTNHGFCDWFMCKLYPDDLCTEE